MEEVWKEVEETYLHISTNELYHDPELRAQFPSIVSMLGIPLKSEDCINCFGEALAILKYQYRKRNIVQNNIKYIPTKTFPAFPQVDGKINPPQDDNHSRALLRKDPNLIHYFKSVPENWEEDILRDKEEAPATIEAPTLEAYNTGIEEIINDVEPEPIPEVYEEPTEPQADVGGMQESGGGADSPAIPPMSLPENPVKKNESGI